MTQNYKVWVNNSILPTTLSLLQSTLALFLETLQQPVPSSPSKSELQRCTQKESPSIRCCKHAQIKITPTVKEVFYMHTHVAKVKSVTYALQYLEPHHCLSF